MATMLHLIRAPDLYKEIVEGRNTLFNKTDNTIKPGYCNNVTYIRIHNLEYKKGIVRFYYYRNNVPILTVFLDTYGIFEMPLQFSPSYEHPLLQICDEVDMYSEIKGTINIVYYWR